MQRIYALERPKPHEFGDLPVYDLLHLWPDGHVEAKVKHRCWVFAYQARPYMDNAGKWLPARIRAWLPGHGEVNEERLFGQEFYRDSKGWGHGTVVSLDGVPLHVFHEIVPGMAQ